MPLTRVENEPYIHHRKGSLVMYARADYIGEDNLIRAIRAFRDDPLNKLIDRRPKDNTVAIEMP